MPKPPTVTDLENCNSNVCQNVGKPSTFDAVPKAETRN
jgi:hypothetical protein